METKDPDMGTQNDALLKRIRQRYRYAIDKWRRNRTEGQKNMRYISGDPWEDEDRNARKGRPTVCADQLNQYVNQVVNTARQNPRGVIIDPAGDGATEMMAQYREDRIRAIEYGCNATQAYINGLQGAVERNIGYWKVTRAYVSDDSDEQEILVLPILNPDSVLIDPDYKEMDASDIKWAFELDRLTMDDFVAEYPNAEKRSFSADDFGGDSNHWWDGESIVVASYWEIKSTPKQVGKRGRMGQTRTVQQYVTNGVEILRKGDPQPGPYIPIVPVFGKEIWVDYGEGGAERVLLSLVSLARDPQKALAYVMSAMLENVGQLPKTSFIGYAGQFETDAEAWKTVNTMFHPYLQVDPVTDERDGQVLPPPQRQPNAPDFQAYAIGVDICKQAIQSAMGIQPLPTPAQQLTQKSGVALSKIQNGQALGSYHLPDNYDRAIKLTGRIINHWLSVTDVGETDKPIREADGTHKIVRINTDMPIKVGDHEYHFPIADDTGRYQVTISSGPSMDSQREEGSEFADLLVENLRMLPLSPQQAQQLLSMVLKLKHLGPIGDQMAEIISPQNAATTQQLAMLQQQHGAMQEAFAKMQAQIQQLTLEKQANIIDRQGQLEVAKLKASTELAVAEITASKDANEAMAERDIATYELLHKAAHERGMQSADHAHELGMAAVKAQAAARSAQQAQAAAQATQATQDTQNAAPGMPVGQ